MTEQEFKQYLKTLEVPPSMRGVEKQLHNPTGSDLTIGFGHKITSKEKESGRIKTGAGPILLEEDPSAEFGFRLKEPVTDAQVQSLFNQDYEAKKALVERDAPYLDDGPAKFGLIDFYYQTGGIDSTDPKTGEFKFPKARQAVRNRDIQAIAKETTDIRQAAGEFNQMVADRSELRKAFFDPSLSKEESFRKIARERGVDLPRKTVRVSDSLVPNVDPQASFDSALELVGVSTDFLTDFGRSFGEAAQITSGISIEGLKKTPEAAVTVLDWMNAAGEFERGLLSGEGLKRVPIEEFTSIHPEEIENPVVKELGWIFNLGTDFVTNPIDQVLAGGAAFRVVGKAIKRQATTAVEKQLAKAQENIKADIQGQKTLFKQSGTGQDGSPIFTFEPGAKVFTDDHGIGTVISKQKGPDTPDPRAEVAEELRDVKETLPQRKQRERVGTGELQELEVQLESGRTVTVSNTSVRPLDNEFDGLSGVQKGTNLEDVEPSDFATIRQRYLDEVERQRRGTMSEAQRRTMADQIIREGRVTPETISGRTPGIASTTEELIATSTILDEELVKLRQLALKAWKSTDAEQRAVNKAAFRRQLELVGELDPSLRGARAEAGRAFAEAGPTPEQEAFRTILEGAETVDTDALMKMFSYLPKEKQLSFIQQTAKSDFAKEMVEKWFTNSLLSNPMIAESVFVSNQTLLTVTTLEKSFGALAQRPRNASREIAVMWDAYIRSFGDIIRGSSTRLANKNSDFENRWTRYTNDLLQDGVQTKLGRSRIQLNKNLEESLELTRPIRAVQAWNAWGRELLITADAVARYQAREIVIAQRSMQEAIRRVDEAGVSMSARERNREISKIYQQLKHNPEGTVSIQNGQVVRDEGGKLKTIAEEADDFGSYVVLADTLRGKVAEPLAKFMNHPVMKITFPFFDVMMRAAGRAAERAPGGASLALSPRIRRDLNAGGVRRRDALGKIALSSALGAYFTNLAHEGLVTGSQPSFENGMIQEMNGAPPNSIGIPRADGTVTFIPCQALESVCVIANGAADVAKAAGWLGRDDPTVIEMAERLVGAVSNLLSNPMFFGELQDTVDVLSGSQGALEKAQRLFRRRLSSALPLSSARRALVRELDEYRRTSDSLWQEVKRSIPGLSNDLPAWVNYRGEEIELPGGYGPDNVIGSFLDALTPGQISFNADPNAIIEKDPVLSEWKRQRFEPRSPDRTFLVPVGQTRVPMNLTMSEWMEHRRIFGRIKIDGKTVWEAMQDTIQSPEYQKADPRIADTKPASGLNEPDQPGLRWQLLQQTHNQYRSLAEQTFLDRHPELIDRASQIAGRRFGEIPQSSEFRNITIRPQSGGGF